MFLIFCCYYYYYGTICVPDNKCGIVVYHRRLLFQSYVIKIRVHEDYSYLSCVCN